VGTVDTSSTSYATRIVVFARSLSWATHTLRVVNVGTVGRPRVVVDAFEVIR
jgi:voltage-gated potassium channel Kch